MTTYYINRTNGSDDNNGLSKANAWKTIDGKSYMKDDVIVICE